MDLTIVKDEIAIFDSIFIKRERVPRFPDLLKRDDHFAPIVYRVDLVIRLLALRKAVYALIDFVDDLPICRCAEIILIDIERHPIGMLGDMMIFERNLIIIFDIQTQFEPRPTVHVAAARAEYQQQKGE